MKKMTYLTSVALIAMSISFASVAKLPDLTPEAKAAAELAKAKAAHGDKKAAYGLCLAQNKVAKTYAVKDKVVSTPDCVDPGEFKAPEVATTPATAKPAEVATAPAKPADAPKK
jgi:hypothetical protein